MGESSRYASPEAARRAVTDRLKIQAAHSPWALADLERQYAYDQLIERLYRVDGGWVIKGATALLARRVSVRHTIDLDVYRAGAIAEAERLLREAAALDIGDWMTFEIGAAVQIHASGAQAARAKVETFIGVRLWSAFQVDLVAEGIELTGRPDPVHPLTDIEILTSPRKTWQAYPLVDHIADKVCAILERHQGLPSTRYKDLVDLVAIVNHATVAASLQREALVKEGRRRGLSLPRAFEVPDRQMWERGYRAEARRTTGLDETNLDAALTTVRPFLNPLLDGTATGSWDPLTQRWLDE